MQPESVKFLETLINTPSPSGFEEPAQQLVAERMEQFCDRVTSDVHGNVMGVVNPAGADKMRVMLAGHVDQIGLMVQHITEEGYCYFVPIGGIDVPILSCQRVLVHGAQGAVPGVIGKRAVHLMTPEERKKVVELKELYIDIGAGSRKEAGKLVAVGDPVTLVAPFQRLAGETAAAGGFDDRVGSFVVVEALRVLARRKPKVAVYGVSTVQEELGLRGARTSAYAIEPAAGIAVDVTHASDYPGSEKSRSGDVRLGKGPVLHRGANINPVLGQLMVDVARRKKIPWQFCAEPGATGTDANAIQINRAGAAAALVSIPNRYMHTPVEVVSLTDLDDCVRLIAETVLALEEDTDFRPLENHRRRRRA